MEKNRKLTFNLTGLRKLMLLAGFMLTSLSACREKEEPLPIVTPDPAASGKIYVANEHAGSISVINAATRKVVKTIPINEGAAVDLMAHNVQVAPDGKTVWVTGVPMDHALDEKMIVIDPVADVVKARIPMSAHLHMAHVVLDENSAFAFVTASDADQVIKINAATHQVAAVYDLGPYHEPHGIRYFQGKLYVANLRSKSMSIIEVASGQITDIPLGGKVGQTAVLPNGKYIFASLLDTREVIRYDLQSGAIHRIPLPQTSQGPIQLYSTPDSKKLFVCDQGILLGMPVSDKVFVIDPEAGVVTNTIQVGNAAHGIVVSKDGKTAYSTNTNDATVSVIDVATEKVVATIPVGFSPNGISFWSESGGMP